MEGIIMSSHMLSENDISCLRGAVKIGLEGVDTEVEHLLGVAQSASDSDEKPDASFSAFSEVKSFVERELTLNELSPKALRLLRHTFSAGGEDSAFVSENTFARVDGVLMGMEDEALPEAAPIAFGR